MIDSGLFHVFSDTDRIRYVRGLENVLNPGARLFLLCFSDATPGMEGPRRVSQSELRHAFADGWEIESLEPVHLEIRPEYRQQGAFFGEDPRGWFLIARRRLKPAFSGAYLSPSFVPPVLEDSGTHFGLEIGIVSPDGVGDLLSTPFRLSVFSEIALQLAVDQSHRESLA